MLPGSLFRIAAGCALLCAFACRSGPEVRPIRYLVPEGTAGFALDVIPAPRESDLSPDAARFEGALDIRYGDLPDGGPDDFELTVRLVVDRPVAFIRSADAAGREWGRLALEQLFVEREGESWIRLGTVRDAPAFPLRGSKRPLAWEHAYRANLDHQARDPAGPPGSRREHVTAVLDPKVLDATEAGVEAVLEFFREWHGRGARRFAVEFDDVPFAMTSETRDRFGSYPRAVVVYFRRLREGLRTIDPDAALYWLPQTYWTNHRLFGSFARDVRRAGGLPEDLGLVLTGPEVISRDIPAREMEDARAAFGLTGRKLLVYDNLGRDGDHGPLTGRHPALAGVADAVFGERGEILHRITRLDWSWNPDAYDPWRSHLLACREVVGPASAPHLSALIRGGGGLSALGHLHRYREASRRLDPPGRAPVDAEELLPRIWRDVGPRRFTANIDTPPDAP